ncbi:alpha/beta fold hydrolase [Cellulosilyticum ruminicola]|uniref:alpha/beta fold hydrolase n=1 Tax=Cellulosilyticum ruminicola TaxID=425254 RepID=UPI000A519852|nr:alpha/beta fold hydrolase [Cellulosilyticum ruminicola]
MTIREYGSQNEKILVLLHPAIVFWDYFDKVIPLLEKRYHLIIPALPGYDKRNRHEDFTSAEQITRDMAKWLIHHGYDQIDLLYGCSMGGAIVLRMLAEQKVKITHAVIESGITPYKLP